MTDPIERITARMREIWPGADLPDNIDGIALRAADDLAGNATREKIALRLCGQSGSGKSTQLMPMAEKYFEARNIKPAHIAVRNFVKYFPSLEELSARVGKENLREATNAFALLLQFLVVGHLARRGVAMALELALLEPLFEEWIIRALGDYEVEMHGIVCPRNISDGFITKRTSASGRIVNEESADYFYREYEHGLASWIAARPGARCVLWAVHSADPVYDGPVSGALAAFQIHRAKDCTPLPEEVLRAAKLRFANPA